MYPLNVSLAQGLGFAVASDEAEHIELTARGYVPAYAGAREVAQLPSPSQPPAEAPAPDIDTLRAKLDAKGIKYDKRWGPARLQSTLDSNG